MSETISARASPTVRRFAAHEWRVYRALRLDALRDAPDAFGSTLAREEAFVDYLWEERLAEGARSATDLPMIAEDGARPVGLAWARIDPTAPDVAALYQVWVDPAYRRRGIGRLMLDSAVQWARTAGAGRLVLNVALGPGSALEFYRRAGFAEEGEPTPLRPGSIQLQQAMRLTLTDRGAGADVVPPS